MKKNILKLIPLINLILLSSCNNITYKDDNPLFIMGESIKADDSVKQEFIEKTKNYHNYLPDGLYKLHRSCDRINMGEYIRYFDFEYQVEYINLESSIRYDNSYTIDYNCPRFIFHEKYSTNDIFQPSWADDSRMIVEGYYAYDGSTYFYYIKYKDNSEKKVYYTNLVGKGIHLSFIYTSYLLEYPAYDLYYSNGIYHFSNNLTSKNIYNDPSFYTRSSYYTEDVSFKYSSDFTQLLELSSVDIESEDPNFDKNVNSYTYKNIYNFKKLDSLNIEIPDLSSYTLNDNSYYENSYYINAW